MKLYDENTVPHLLTESISQFIVYLSMIGIKTSESGEISVKQFHKEVIALTILSTNDYRREIIEK